MNTNPIRQFKSVDVDLILLRLKLSDIQVELWMDLDGFFNYSLNTKDQSALSLLKKSTTLNWARIDEVISQLAYDASIVFPESVFAVWYAQHEEHTDYNLFPLPAKEARAKVAKAL